MRNVAAAMVFCMTLSCSDINAVKNTVNEQNDRLSSLEDALESVNGNTLAISALMEGKILITGFEERTDGAGTVVGYRLDLSDGQTVEVTFGDRLDALVPVVGVDEEGTFIYSMDGGKTFSPVEGADKAFAEDGTSPEVGLDGDGYWTVSVDGGQSWTRMLDANGLPVNAFSVNSSGGNTFFSDVRYDSAEGVMHFVMKTGEELAVPVGSAITFSVSHYTAGEEICLGEEMKYPVRYSGVKEAFFSVPDGWRAVLDEDWLYVYAPDTGEAGEYDIVLTLVSSSGMLESETFSYVLDPVMAQPEWKLDWEDEFDEGRLDDRYWRVVERANTTALRYMSSDPRCYEFRDGCIVMKAIKNDDMEKDPVPYLTGGIYTKNLKEFKPGRIEVRARLHSVQGTQPAIWAGSWEGIQWSWGGEIDIMECYNTSKNIYQTVHSHYTYDLGFDDDPVNQVKVELDPSEFHVYAVEQHEDEVVFYVDGNKTMSYPKIDTPEEGQFPFYSSIYLFLDIQIVNEEWAGAVDESALPGEIEIDWVRHYVWK